MRSGVGLAHLALLYRLLAKLLHARLYPRHARVQEAGLRLDGDDLKPFLRRSLSNSMAHQPQPNHAHAFDLRRGRESPL